MLGDNQQIIYCVDDEYRIFCVICDKVAMDSYCNNLLKTLTQCNIFYKKQRLNNTNTNISPQFFKQSCTKNWITIVMFEIKRLNV